MYNGLSLDDRIKRLNHRTFYYDKIYKVDVPNNLERGHLSRYAAIVEIYCSGSVHLERPSYDPSKSVYR